MEWMPRCLTISPEWNSQSKRVAFRFEVRHARLLEFIDSVTDIYVFRGTRGIEAFHDYARGEKSKPIAGPFICV